MNQGAQLGGEVNSYSGPTSWVKLTADVSLL